MTSVQATEETAHLLTISCCHSRCGWVHAWGLLQMAAFIAKAVVTEEVL